MCRIDMTDERAAFEASAGPESVHRQFEKDEDGDYLHAATQIDWRVWQERAALDRSAALEAALRDARNDLADRVKYAPQLDADMRTTELLFRIDALLKKDSGNE